MLIYLSAGAIVLAAIVVLYLDFVLDERRFQQARMLGELSTNLRKLKAHTDQISATHTAPAQVLAPLIEQRTRLLSRLTPDKAFHKQALLLREDPIQDNFRWLQSHWNDLRSLLDSATENGLTQQETAALQQQFALHRQSQQSLWQLFSRRHEQQHRERSSLLLIFAATIFTGLGAAAWYSWRLLRREKGISTQLSREQERLQDYIDLVDLIFVLLDTDGRVISINRAGCELLGLPRDKLVGKHWFDTFIPARDQRATKDLFARLMRGEVEPLEYFENHIVNVSGEEHLILWHNSVSRNEHGVPAYTISAGMDVTDLKQAQVDLTKSEQKYKTLLHTLPYGVQEIDTDGTIVYTNPRHDQIYGYTAGGMRGMNVCDLPASEQTRRELRSYLQYIVHDRPVPEPFHSIDRAADGRLIEVEVEWDYLFNEHRELIGFISVITDVTREKQTQHALAESEARFREIMEHSNQIYWLGNRDPHRLLYVSPQLESIWGMPVELAYERPQAFLEWVHPGDRDRVEATYHQWLEQDIDEYAMEYRILRPDGLLKWVHSRCYTVYEDDSQIKRFCGVIEDITDRKRIEQDLRDSEVMLRQITESINEVFFMRDTEAKNMLYVSSAFERIWGRSCEELYADPRAFVDAVHPEDKQQVLEQLTRQDSGGPLFNSEYRIIRSDGEVRWIWARTFPITDADGRIYRVAGLAEDITQRKAIEHRLRASEQKYRIFIEQASDPVLIADLDGYLQETNARALDLLGYTREELRHLHVSKIHPERELPRIEQAFDQLREQGSTIYIDGFVLTKGGQEVPIEIAANCIESDGRQLAIGIFRDISARKRLEAQRLRHERRQRDVLVREVHHRIKNNLQGVIGLLRENLGDGSEPPLFYEAIEQIRTIAIVYGLQAKSSSSELRLCDITEAIVQHNRSLNRADADIAFHSTIASPMRVNEADAVPFALVINELMTNAIKHTPDNFMPKQIEVSLDIRHDGASLRIFNRGGQLPGALDLTQRRGLGTGFELVLSLLPHKGTMLRAEQKDNGVEVRLELEREILSAAESEHRTTNELELGG